MDLAFLAARSTVRAGEPIPWSRRGSAVCRRASQPPFSSGGPTYGWDDEFYRLDGGRLLITIRPNTVLEIR